MATTKTKSGDMFGKNRLGGTKGNFHNVGINTRLFKSYGKPVLVSERKSFFGKNSEVKIIKPADPEKLKLYKELSE